MKENKSPLKPRKSRSWSISKATPRPRKFLQRCRYLKDFKIQGVTTSDVQEGKLWTVVYEGQMNLDDYGKKLKSAGFKIATVNMDGSGNINGEKEDLNRALMVGEHQSVLTVFKG